MDSKHWVWALATPSLLATPDETWLRWLEGQLQLERQAGIASVAIARDPAGATIRITRPGIASPPPPNPWVAAGGSLLLPGAGQIYAGDWLRGSLFLGMLTACYAAARFEPAWRDGCTDGLLGLSLLAPLDAFWLAQQTKPVSP